MFDHLDDTRADRALQAGLRDLPTPGTSSDFEARILAALAPHPPWWQTVWSAVRPALPTALCALSVMLILLHLAQQAPLSVLPPQPPVMAREAGRGMLYAAPQESSIESMDNIDLNSDSLSFLSHPIRRIPGKRG